MKKIYVLLFILFLRFNFVFGQVTIQPLFFNESFISPQELLRVDIINPGSITKSILTVDLKDQAGNILLTSSSFPFILKAGMARYESPDISVQKVAYGNNELSNYLKNYHSLSKGKYECCYTLIFLQGNEVSQVICDPIVSDLQSSFFLNNPFDGEELSTTTPLLMWNLIGKLHTDPSVRYQLVLSEWPKKQSKESVLSGNKLLMNINDLASFQIPYLNNSDPLMPGKRYVWQVRKLINNQLIDFTDIWSFSIKKDGPEINRAAVLRLEEDAGFYTAINSTIVFRFEEPFTNSAEFTVNLRSEKGTSYKLLAHQIIDTDEKTGKTLGTEQYKIDLNNLSLKKQFMHLEVRDGKGLLYKLKIYIP